MTIIQKLESVKSLRGSRMTRSLGTHPPSHVCRRKAPGNKNLLEVKNPSSLSLSRVDSNQRLAMSTTKSERAGQLLTRRRELECLQYRLERKLPNSTRWRSHRQDLAPFEGK